MQSLKCPNTEDQDNNPCTDGVHNFTAEDSIEIFLGCEVSKRGIRIILRQPLLGGRIMEAFGFQNP